jgi:hypothetical protein
MFKYKDTVPGKIVCCTCKQSTAGTRLNLPSKNVLSGGGGANHCMHNHVLSLCCILLIA